MKNTLTLLIVVLTSIFQIQAQGLIKQALTERNQEEAVIGCGSYEFMAHVNHKAPGFLDLFNKMMLRIGDVVSIQKQEHAVLEIPVVFYVVYNNNNNNEEDIPDLVLHNQIERLNDCFRRTNADVVNTRSEFNS